MKEISEENLAYLLELIATQIVAGASSVIIDVATLNSLGIVKPDGTTITIDNGVISANPVNVGIATTSTNGIAKPDNETIVVDANGTLRVNLASYSESELIALWAAAKAAVDNS